MSYDSKAKKVRGFECEHCHKVSKADTALDYYLCNGCGGALIGFEDGFVIRGEVMSGTGEGGFIGPIISSDQVAAGASGEKIKVSDVRDAVYESAWCKPCLLKALGFSPQEVRR